MNATTIESVGVTDEGHEKVIFCRDAETGLQAIIALYPTVLSPRLGETRFHPYPNETAAIKDVLVASCSPADGGAGGSFALAAHGMFRDMQASAQHIWGTGSLEGNAVAIAGVSKVGRQLAALLIEASAKVSVNNPRLSAVRDLAAALPTVHVVSAEEEFVASPLDVFALCAWVERSPRRSSIRRTSDSYAARRTASWPIAELQRR